MLQNSFSPNACSFNVPPSYFRFHGKTILSPSSCPGSRLQFSCHLGYPHLRVWVSPHTLLFLQQPCRGKEASQELSSVLSLDMGLDKSSLGTLPQISHLGLHGSSALVLPFFLFHQSLAGQQKDLFFFFSPNNSLYNFFFF